jgi:chemotaxis protein methyltransferase CheR
MNKPFQKNDPRGQAIVQGEFLLTQEDFRQIAAILHADAGISLPDTKATLVYSRLAKRLRALGLQSFGDYCELVDGDNAADERQRMIAALTTNVTRFFREPHHFEHLKTMVLPSLLEVARRGEPVRLWSAGCSNGQEPYSIALVILSLMPEAAQLDLRVLATDIDNNMLAEGRRGIYSDSSVANVPPDLRKRWFVKVDEPDAGTWSVADGLRNLVVFRELNLLAQWPMHRRFQAIFCRNVVIYFDEQTQAKLWTRFRQALAPRGRLYIGHSERLARQAQTSFDSDGITIWRLRQGVQP